ncbi:MAG: deoxynucleoside kinase [Chitinophagaceae bacterium]|nr:deoxynucleoside kinase [Chitinophagaceae bacterium]
MNYNFITIEGNIGAGKTTLCHLLQQHFGAKLILEEFEDNSFLPKFYQNKEQYAFPLELSFMASRFNQLKEIINSRNLFGEKLISDYLFIKSKLFAKINLQNDEYGLYEKLFEIINPNLPQPDLLIYLHAPLIKLKENIKNRNRSYELDISDDYLENLQDAYLEILNSLQIPILIVDALNTDFLNNKSHFNQLLSYLEKDFESGKHYINF